MSHDGLRRTAKHGVNLWLKLMSVWWVLLVMTVYSKDLSVCKSFWNLVDFERSRLFSVVDGCFVAPFNIIIRGRGRVCVCLCVYVRERESDREKCIYILIVLKQFLKWQTINVEYTSFHCVWVVVVGFFFFIPSIRFPNLLSNWREWRDRVDARGRVLPILHTPTSTANLDLTCAEDAGKPRERGRCQHCITVLVLIL